MSIYQLHKPYSLYPVTFKDFSITCSGKFKVPSIVNYHHHKLNWCLPVPDPVFSCYPYHNLLSGSNYPRFTDVEMEA